MRSVEFFLQMKIPNVTHQEKKIAVHNGKPVVYEDERLRDARQKFMAYLAQHRPEKPLKGAVELRAIWMYLPTGNHKLGDYKTTKPDLDNLVKLFQDCMTELGFWKDDAQVVLVHTMKCYAIASGILVRVAELDPHKPHEM